MIPKIVQQLWTRRSIRLLNHVRFFSTRVIDEEIPDFGSYSVILPEEPFVWGVSHIHPRTVPCNIRRPSYARTLAEENATLHSSRTGPSREPHKDDSRIQLGSEEETRLRASAKLARKVRAFSGTLVQVRTIFKAQSMDGMLTPILV